MKTFLAVALCGFIVFIPTFSQAANFGSALSIATVNIPPGADVAGMGNCWVATSNFSTNNPATIAASNPPFRFGASYSYGLIAFKRGPNLNIHIGSASVTLPKGVLQLNLSNANSGSAGTAMNVNAKFFYAPTIELMYGLKIVENLIRDGDKIFWGIGGSLSMAKMNFSLAGQNVLISRSRGFAIKGGFLYQPWKGLNFGGMYAYTRERNDERGLNESQWLSKRSTGNVYQFRLGASWQILPVTMFATDYQYLNIGHLKRNQIFLGIEQYIIKEALAIYGGWANSGPTAGIGAYWKWGGINAAYMANPFCDLNRHLDRSQTTMATIFFQF